MEFDAGRATPTGEGQDKLAKLQQALIDRPGLKIDIMRRLILIVCLALAPAALAAEAAKAPAERENFFKRAGKAIGRDAKAGWQQAKQGYSKSAKDLGRGTAGAAKRVGGEMKDSAKRTGKAAKEEFK